MHLADWWRSRSTRFQLSTAMLAIVVLMSSALMLIVYKVDLDQRKQAAIALTHQVTETLQEYFADVIEHGEKEDLIEHLEAFHPIDGVEILSRDGSVIFHYQRPDVDWSEYAPHIDRANARPTFLDGGEDLLIRLPVHDESGHPIGSVRYVVDIESLASQLQDDAFWLAVSLPLFLALAGALAWRISHAYSRPIERLVTAMQHADAGDLHPIPENTQQENEEIRLLYHGYNQLVERVRQTTQTLRRQAMTDPLTGLLNRRGLERAYEQLLAQQPDTPHVAIAINLDDFRLINNELGQRQGDNLLQQVAALLTTQAPDQAHVARLHGDHFLLIFPGDPQAGAALAQSLHRTLNGLHIDSITLSATLSWLAFTPAHYGYDMLLNATEDAVHQARTLGRGGLHHYQADANANQDALHTLAQIKKALSGEGARFELFAQPIISLDGTDSRHHYEVLLRLYDEADTLITPDRFLGVAQHFNLLTDIDQWVVHACIDTLRQHPAHLQNLGHAHINVSGVSLHSERFQQFIRDLVTQYPDFPWQKIELELTETSAVTNFAQAKDFIDWCRQQGIPFALDDFGTGTASFEYMKFLPFDTVKIDGLFIRNMHDDPLDLAVIRHIREVTRLRGQKTVAEFVETAEDVALLKDIGIDYGQGYYFAKPQPLIEQIQQA